MAERRDLELLKGAIDIHVHSSPSLFHRHDTVEIAKHSRDMGIRGLILKSHHYPTIDRSLYVSQRVPGIDLFHSVTLNYAVGGINPFAVDVAIKMGAKCIWMPTIDTAHQKEHYGALGGYGTKQSFDVPACYERAEGINILDDQGKLKSEVSEVVELVAGGNVILAVGHLTYPEIKTLVREAVKAGSKKMVIDHPHLPFCNLSLQEQEELVKEGAVLNYCFSEISPKWWSISVEDFAERIQHIGPENVVLSTDLGQVHNPLPAEGLRLFIELLLEAGIPSSEIHRMTHENPERLVYG
jgi:hypothetical protein